jgi:chorismate mutase
MRRETLRALATCAAALVLPIGGCAAPAAPHDPLDALLRLIDERLEVGEDVARSKWNSGAPIEDAPREREIVAAIAAQAPAHGLDPAVARTFFEAQIEASKVLQHARHAQWRAGARAPFEHAPDLRADIRPRLDRLTPELLDALARAQSALRAPDAAGRINAHATDAARTAALAPLAAMAGKTSRSAP